MKKDEYFAVLATRFAASMPVAVSELDYTSPYELLVAVVLSAQCTDKRVNTVTPALFAAYPTPDTLAKASVDEVFELVRSISYPRAKATHLVGAARLLVEQHHSKVPSSRSELESLPGVGRKTASVLLSVLFDRGEIAVDTHVFRLAHRLGLAPASAKTPLAVEHALVKGFSNPKVTAAVPQISNVLGTAHHWLILHGRYVCTARKPQCAACVVADLCPSGQ